MRLFRVLIRRKGDNVKILFMAPMLNYSGASKIMVWLANQFWKDETDVFVLTYNSVIENLSLLDNIHKDCLEIPFSKSFIRRNLVLLPKSVFRSYKYIKNGEFDCIITFTDTVSILCLVLVKMFGKTKFVISERMDPYTNTGKSDQIRRKLFCYADGIVFQTKEAKRYFNNKLDIPFSIIPNPVIVNFEDKEIVKRNNEIVFVGRLAIKQKRQDLLLEAFSQIVKSFSEIRLVIYGDGEDQEKIYEIIEKKKLESKVVLAGVTNDVYGAIHEARLYVMTSDFEGVPNSLIEAMSMGVPVISTDCSPGGARSLIDNYKNGILIPNNNVDALVEAMTYMLNHPYEAELMGIEAKKIRSKYSEDKVFQMWRKFIYNDN